MSAADRREFLAPGRLWSLREIMFKFDVRLLVTRLSHIERFEGELLGRLPFPSGELLEGDSFDNPLNASGKKWLWAHLGPLSEEIKPLGLDTAQAFIQNVWNHACGLPALPGKDIAIHLNDLRRAVEEELRDKSFLYLSSQEAKLFDEKFPFGEDVANAFPSAEMDISEAAKCLALGQNNAVVYHLMMAAEFGVRVLAADRRVVITNRNGNNVPLDFAQWGEILAALQKEIDKIKNWPVSPSRAQAQQFYSDAMLSARSFNDGYRTHIAHGRSKLYEKDETLALYGHVKRFLVKLAERISESMTMPVIWP